MVSDYSVSRRWLAGFNHVTPVLSIALGAKNRAENKISEVLVYVWLICSDLFICLSAVGLDFKIWILIPVLLLTIDSLCNSQLQCTHL